MRKLGQILALILFIYSGVSHAEEQAKNQEEQKIESAGENQESESANPAAAANKQEENETVIKVLYSETIVSERSRGSTWSDNTIICKQLKRADSRFKEERCMTASQWEFLRKETREGLQRYFR